MSLMVTPTDSKDKDKAALNGLNGAHNWPVIDCHLWRV